MHKLIANFETDDIQTTVVAPDVVAAIIGKLGDEDFNMQQAALTSLVELAKYSMSVHLVMTYTSY
jgi:hypothetical protein